MNYSTLLHSISEVRIPPKNVEPEDHWLFAHEYSKLIDPCISIVFHDVHVFGGSFFAYRLGYIDPFFPGPTFARSLKSRLLDLPSFAFPPLNVESAIFPSPTFGIGYFHWFSDYLPIVQAASDSFDHCHSLILPDRAGRFEFVPKSLQNFNFNILWARRFQHIKVQKLHVIGPASQSGNYRTDLFKQTITTVKTSLEHSGIHDCESNEVVYVSRQDAQRRFVLNEVDVTSVIMGFGGRVVMLEGLSLQDQYALFSKCKLIVGLHGAGLTNMVWMSPGSNVLEIRNTGDSTNNCYFSMASALGHNYYYIQAKNIDEHVNTYSANLIVDVELLHQVIHEVFI